jgi:hypothetical protein
LQEFLDLCVPRSCLAEIHQFPDGAIFETLHRHVPLEILDRDLAGEAVVGAVKANQPGYDPLSSGARSVKMAYRMVFSRPNDTTYRVALIEISRMGNDDAQLADEKFLRRTLCSYLPRTF